MQITFADKTVIVTDAAHGFDWAVNLFGVIVNNSAPGFVRSNPNTERQWAAYGAEGQQALVAGIALRRLGAPEDIAHGVMFLASDYAGWISEQVLGIDGGK